MRFYIALIFIVSSILIFGCNSNKLDSVPANFIGEWETPAEKYKDLIIEIQDELILFKDPNKQTPPEIYSISKIEKDDNKDNLFTVFYETKDSLEYQFAFYYEESEGGIIRLKNQKRFEWKKIVRK